MRYFSILSLMSNMSYVVKCTDVQSYFEPVCHNRKLIIMWIIIMDIFEGIDTFFVKIKSDIFKWKLHTSEVFLNLKFSKGKPQIHYKLFTG
jgi:hypothetical protein